MGSITAWLERSIEKCSLEDGQCHCSDTSEPEMDNRCAAQHRNSSNHDSTLLAVASSAESDHENSLPSHWEQCLHLKTGEVYFIDWSNGMKVKEDPRRTTAGYNGDSDEEEEEENRRKGRRREEIRQDSVLVVAACKSCLMYRMVPKNAEVCPKCSGQLLHFNPYPTSFP